MYPDEQYDSEMQTIVEEIDDSNPRIGIDDGYPDKSYRWQAKHPQDKRTMILYGSEEECRKIATTQGYTDFQESGYYDFSTNTVVDAKDGPVTFIDNRKSGGGSRGPG